MAHSSKKGAIRVLYVDDDPYSIEISKQILMDIDARFEISDACCVDVAFKKLETGQYDVVVSDYELPLKNGLEFLKELRKNKNEIPYILFTGKGREEVAVKALNLGADSYISKIGSTKTVFFELADAINKAIQRKKSKELLAGSETKYRTSREITSRNISYKSRSTQASFCK